MPSVFTNRKMVWIFLRISSVFTFCVGKWVDARSRFCLCFLSSFERKKSPSKLGLLQWMNSRLGILLLDRKNGYRVVETIFKVVRICLRDSQKRRQLGPSTSVNETHRNDLRFFQQFLMLRSWILMDQYHMRWCVEIWWKGEILTKLFPASAFRRPQKRFKWICF